MILLPVETKESIYRGDSLATIQGLCHFLFKEGPAFNILARGIIKASKSSTLCVVDIYHVMTCAKTAAKGYV